jgi:hypothetical protein
MNKPKKPYPPFEFDYREKVERRYIYRFYQTLGDEWDEEHDEEKEVPLKPIAEVDLGWLVSLIPERVSINQIKIDFGYNANSMAFEDHYVGFYYEVVVPARDAEFKAAQQEYEVALRQYEEDVKEYERVSREEEIRETEEKLARLKGEGK